MPEMLVLVLLTCTFFINFAESDIRVSTCKFLTNCQTIFSSAKIIELR
ncbi:hypothetical protein HMPREF3226_01473 [Prevotella corporis]|uniref:Uncharacterized protein n=1 Tax=Prevotella corporis TaxID=28128 RepID=A0A133Q6Y0_9BACT|nr:hypothetical protein HMPREF3226_01473 [Prevotella corporis]